MKNFINVTLINICALFILSSILGGIIISSWQTLINIYLKPIIKIITLPINFLTLGLFTLFINAFLLIFVESLVKGFYIKNFSTAFIGALLLSIIYLIIEKFVIVRNKDFYEEKKTEKRITKDNVIDVEGTYEEETTEEKNNKRLEN